MKRKWLAFFSALFVFVLAFCFVGCGENEEPKSGNEPVEPVVITAGDMVVNGATLLDIMEAEGLSFELSDGMVVSINGVANDADYDPCWMLYTSDEENSSTAWGSYEYEGQTLGSASYGAGELLVKPNEVYVWVYQSF